MLKEVNIAQATYKMYYEFEGIFMRNCFTFAGNTEKNENKTPP